MPILVLFESFLRFQVTRLNITLLKMVCVVSAKTDTIAKLIKFLQ